MHPESCPLLLWPAPVLLVAAADCVFFSGGACLFFPQYMSLCVPLVHKSSAGAACLLATVSPLYRLVPPSRGVPLIESLCNAA